MGGQVGVPNARSSERGFSLVELLFVCAVIALVSAMVVPQSASMMGGYKLKGNAEALNNMVSLARMRAAAQYSRARVRANLTARTFQLERWDKTGAGSWVTEGPVIQLADGVSFGFATIATAPPDTQLAIAQAPVCTDNGGADMADTACVTFNSRGMPVTNVLPTPGGGVIVGDRALYITDGAAVYGTTVSAAPFIKSWWSKNADNSWVRQ
jgi:prepilin-type N-terminal cleavage/methylation domain-containing protein